MYHTFGPSIYEELGVVEEPELPFPVTFQTGALIAQPLPDPLPIVVEHTADRPPGDYLEMTIPVMSARLVEALARAGVDNLQTYAASVSSESTSDRWSSYYAVNVIGVISAADLEHSTFSDPGGRGVLLLDFDELVLDESKTRGALLFRLAEAPRILLIHDAVKTKLLAETPALRGLFFEEVAGHI
jgi:hypothetical protein